MGNRKYVWMMTVAVLMFGATSVLAQTEPVAPPSLPASPEAAAPATPDASTPPDAAPPAPEAEKKAHGASDDPMAQAPEAEDPGWEVAWRDYIGKVKTYSEKELPAKLKLAGAKEETKQTAEVQFVLGYMYQYGEGVAPDDMMAQKWYNKSAKGKYSRAMIALGEFYMGYGDAALATKWFKRGAEAGEAYASYKLGEIYEYGFGNTIANPTKAFNSYTEAAKRGVQNAWLKLGQFYQYGYGVAVDMDKAIEYYKKLLDTDNKVRKQQVEYMLSEVYATIAEQYSGKQRMDWLLKSANKNNMRSVVRVADIYNVGDGDVEQNVEEALKWYEKAAALGDVYSMVKLGYIYNNGTMDMDPDYCKAFEYFFNAAEKGSKEAMYNLGNFYYNGYCKAQDYDKANEWWRRSQGR